MTVRTRVGVAVALVAMLGLGGGAGDVASTMGPPEGAVAVCRTPGGLTALAYSPDGQWLALGTSMGEVEVRKVESLELLALLTGHVGKIAALAFSPNGKLLASASEDATLRLWEVATGKKFRVLGRHIGQVDLAVMFSPDGELLVMGLSDGFILV